MGAEVRGREGGARCAPVSQVGCPGSSGPCPGSGSESVAPLGSPLYLSPVFCPRFPLGYLNYDVVQCNVMWWDVGRGGLTFVRGCKKLQCN